MNDDETKIQSVAQTVIPPAYPSIFNLFLVALAVASRLTRWIKKERDEQPRGCLAIATSSPVFTRGTMRRLSG